MKLQTLCQYTVVGMGLLALAGCNMVGKNAKPAGASVASGVPGNTASNASATTYGLNGSGSVKGQAGATTQGGQMAQGQGENLKRVVNSIKAPENQTYYFLFNSFSVNDQDRPAIDAQARYLVLHPKAKVRLEGNTDDRGSREYNIALGWSRDKAVEGILEQKGVGANQIAMVSFGKERPEVSENNEAAWALNRRVNLVYERT